MANKSVAKNPASMDEFDSVGFEELCRKSGEVNSPEEANEISYALLAYCEALISIKRGTEEGEPQYQKWQEDYVAAACRLSKYFEENNRYSDILMAMTAATKVDPLSRPVYMYTFRALQKLKMKKAIVTTYHRMEHVLADAFGEVPDEEITNIYTEARADLDEKEEDLLVIKDELKTVQQENYEDEGPLFCSYDVLKYLFQILSRTNERTAMRVVILLLSLSPAEGKEADPKETATAMMMIRDVLIAQLRRSDTVAKYSTNQYVIMLSVAKEESAAGAKARIMAQSNPILEKGGLTMEFLSATPGGA